MSYQVSPGDLSVLRFNEGDTVSSALQNIAVILSTRKGAVPLYRDFGLNMDFLDKPVPVAKVMMISEVREAVERWEPRATVLGVTFSEDPARPGILIPTVEVEIRRE